MPVQSEHERSGLRVQVGSTGTGAGFAVVRIDALVEEFNRRWPESPIDAATAAARLEAVADSLPTVLLYGFLDRLRLDVPAVQVEREPVAPLDAVTRRRVRDRVAAGLAVLKVLREFDEPATAILGRRRPRLRVADLDGDPPLTFGEYVGLAVAVGQGDALDAICHHFTRYRRKVGADWPTILRAYAETRDALDGVMAEIRRTDDVSAALRAPDRAGLRRRLEAARLKGRLAGDDSPPLARDLAARLVGFEWGVKPSSILQRWKVPATRKRYLSDG